MCDVSYGFRLCTCSGEGPFDWVLQRQNHAKPEMYARGMTIRPTDDERLQALFVLDGLNTGRSFDFDYEPIEGDVLWLTQVTQAQVFRYQEGAWQIEEGAGLARWAEQMEPLLQGALRLASDLDVEGPVWERLRQAPTDPEVRTVAIDWLHAHGHHALATWLRLEGDAVPGTPTPGLEAAAAQIAPRLRAELSSAPLTCDRQDCPGDWAALEPTSNPLVRVCRVCAREGCFVTAPGVTKTGALLVQPPK